jgi:ribosome modulation factor
MEHHIDDPRMDIIEARGTAKLTSLPSSRLRLKGPLTIDIEVWSSGAWVARLTPDISGEGTNRALAVEALAKHIVEFVETHAAYGLARKLEGPSEAEWRMLAEFVEGYETELEWLTPAQAIERNRVRFEEIRHEFVLGERDGGNARLHMEHLLEGYRARIAWGRDADCPYSPGSARAKSWLRGVELAVADQEAFARRPIIDYR